MAKDNIIVSVSKSYSGALCRMCSKGAMTMEGGCSAALCPKREKEQEEKREDNKGGERGKEKGERGRKRECKMKTNKEFDLLFA